MEGKPDTFGFLGFMHICGKSRKSSFLLTRHTQNKRLRAKRGEGKEIRFVNICRSLLRGNGCVRYYVGTSGTMALGPIIARSGSSAPRRRACGIARSGDEAP